MFTVIMILLALLESKWSARATSPLPVPFSPVIRTLASEGATRVINSITGRIWGELEMMSGIFPRSSSFFASSCWLLRSALPSAIWVRTMARRRSLSHGLGTKSRAPSFIASTARSIVAQAVMTTMGNVSSLA